LWFHVLLDQYPEATEEQRHNSMLTALETESRRFLLLWSVCVFNYNWIKKGEIRG
jgi:hypothetical protein